MRATNDREAVRSLSKWIAVLVAVVMAIAAGCETRQQTGTLVGAGAGALLGRTLTDSGWGMLLGAALGGFVGREIGQEMDRRDQERMAYALREMPTGRSYGWVNPDTGTYWEMEPTETYRSPTGHPCREFSVLARIEGRAEETRGTACLTPDGTWEIVG